MLEKLIHLSLQQRNLVVALAVGLLLCGGLLLPQLPVDVLPNLTRPRVIIITECPGMAPEEVETRVTIPLENALNGATDVQDVRSSSDIGLSVVQVEFDWGQEIFRARQIVQERIATVADLLPRDVQPQMAPMSSLLGQIMLIGMWSREGKVDPLEMRTQADWVVANRLRSLPGIAQVIVMGGGKKQIQVLVDIHQLHTFDLSIADVEQSLRDANLNVTGGFLEDGSQELLVRGLGRVVDRETLELVVVRNTSRRPVLIRDIARVVEGAAAKRGDCSINGQSAVVLTIQKQPKADTRQLTAQILEALSQIRPSLPEDIELRPTYQQREFIDNGIENVTSALSYGSLLVILILWLFLMNLRTTLITVLVIPLSLAATILIFYRWQMGINVMTLGGLAVGLGMLVDDAIVGVENAFRRLRENTSIPTPLDPMQVVLLAMREVLRAIIVSTLLVVVVFAPLLLLSGIEGLLFTPLAIAYLVSIAASTLIALTVTPALSLMLLPQSVAGQAGGESVVLQLLKKLATPLIQAGLTRRGLLAAGLIIFFSAAWALQQGAQLKKDFLPAFDEGATQVNLYSVPGTSLDAMRRISQVADQQFRRLQVSPENPQAPLLDITCKLGRAELDEHIMGVNVAEYVMTMNPHANIHREEMIQLLNDAIEALPGLEHEVEQPIAHLISHMLSGVAAQIAIKIHGDDLDVLRRKGEEIRRAIQDLPGIADPFVEQQKIIPQLRFELDYFAMADYGVSARQVTDLIETAMQGRVVGQFMDEQRVFEIIVRMDDPYRQNIEQLNRLHLDLDDGRRLLLGSLVRMERGGGPNMINRENARRRIVIRVNTLGGDLGGAVERIQQKIAENVSLPEGYFVSYGGQFQARQSAQNQIALFSLVSLLAVLAILYSYFPSLRLVLQILAAVPVAFIGGALGLIWTQQSLSIAALVGFVSVAGIATRNGLLLIGTYQQLISSQGLSKETLLQGSLERLAPVLMSSMTTGLGLLPLVFNGNQPGKEMLYPVATVIVGGLLTSTLAEIFLRPGLYWFTTQTGSSPPGDSSGSPLEPVSPAGHSPAS
jgi:CzcA family heavy metal efflux pump